MSNLQRGSRPTHIHTKPKRISATTQAFSAKQLDDGSKIFRRVRGMEAVISSNPVNIDFVVPFSQCKISGLQILGASLGDKVHFQILDTAAGTLSGTPNAVLNTFGENVYLIPGEANYSSRYDADLIQGLTLRIVYHSNQGVTEPFNKVYVNFDLHEVVVP